MVINDNNQYALLALAEYQREQDIPLIINNRDKRERAEYFFTYSAIPRFPHPDFLPFLQKQLMSSCAEIRFDYEVAKLFSAIASFKSEKAVELLELSLDTPKPGAKANYVFDAIDEFFDPVYEDLYWSLWDKEKLLSKTVFTYLWQRDPQRALSIAKRTFHDDIETFRSFLGLSFAGYASTSPSLIEIMLDTIATRDMQYAVEIIRTNIDSADVHAFPLFARKAAAIRDESFIQPLFNRLEKDDNAYIYLEAAEALIAYNDPGINKRIVEARNK